MTEEVDLKEKLQHPAQLLVKDGLTESYPKLEAAVFGWRRLSPEEKVEAVIWCDGEIIGFAEIEALDAAI